MRAHQGTSGPEVLLPKGHQSGGSLKGNRGSKSRLPFRQHSKNADGFPLLPVLRASGKSRGGKSTVARESYLRELFDEQARLIKSIVRQSNLLKVDRRDVNSVDTELHRQVTDEIVRVSAHLANDILPGEYTYSSDARVLAPDQVIFDQMYCRQGIRYLGGEIQPLDTKYQVIRQKSFDDPTETKQVLPGKFLSSQLFRLEGPALRLYLKALERGYRGGPNQWLRSKYARQALPVLARKGLIGPIEKRAFSVFSPKAPLRFWLRQNTNLQHPVRLGFRDERVVEYGSLSVLSRQKKCSRLPSNEWPREGGRRLWPSTPTLFESWEQVVLSSGRKQQHCDNTVPNCVSLASVRENPELAKKVARHNVFGIRAWIPVPEKFRWYFKYRWGFLILRRRVPLSIGVVRFVLSLWKRAPMQCFLLHNVPLRFYLKMRMPPQFITETSFMDRSFATFASSAPSPSREKDPDWIRPFLPIRWKPSMDREQRLEKGRGGVRLT